MGGYSRLEGPSTDRAYPNMIEEVRFAPDSALEGEGFEPSVPRRGQHFSRLPRSSFWETAGWFRRCRDSKTTSCSAAGPLMKADPRRAWEEELR